MAGAKWAHKIQLGRESTPGTAVAATTIWRGAGGNLKDIRETVEVDEQIGIAIPSNRIYQSSASGALSMAATPATYQQILHILEAGIKSVGTGAADGVGTGKVYAYPMGHSTVNTIKTYTIETGDNQQAEEMAYAFVESFTLSAERGQAVEMSAEWIGHSVSDTTFTGSLSVPVVREAIANRAALYIDDSSGTIGTTQVTGTLLSWELQVTTGWRAKWVMDKDQLTFDFIYFDPDSFEATLTATFEHNATAVAEKNKWRSNTGRLIRIDTLGQALATAGTTYSRETLRLNMATRWTEFDALDADEGNSIISVTGKVGYDAVAAKSLEIIVVPDGLVSVP